MIFLNQIESTIRKATSSNYDSVRCTITLFDLYISADVAHIADVYSRVIDGYHEFPGVEELVRAYMQQNNRPVIVPNVKYYYYLNGEVTSNPVVTNLGILYHASKLIIPSYLTADEIVDNLFLIPYKSVFAIGVSSFTLYYYANTAGTITITRTYADGTTDTSTSASSTGFASVVVNKSDSVYAHVEFGKRKADVYFVEATNVESLSFRNVFNVLEYISIPATFESNIETDFETAQQDHVIQRYDVVHNLEMSIKTNALPAGMYNQLCAMCSARLVKYLSRGFLPDVMYREREILIEKYKLPKSTEPNTPLTFEMKFKYCDTELNDAVVLS